MKKFPAINATDKKALLQARKERELLQSGLRQAEEAKAELVNVPILNGSQFPALFHEEAEGINTQRNSIDVKLGKLIETLTYQLEVNKKCARDVLYRYAGKVGLLPGNKVRVTYWGPTGVILSDLDVGEFGVITKEVIVQGFLIDAKEDEDTLALSLLAQPVMAAEALTSKKGKQKSSPAVNLRVPVDDKFSCELLEAVPHQAGAHQQD